jgi:hypothetical protein
VNGVGLSGACNPAAADDIIKREVDKMRHRRRHPSHRFKIGDLVCVNDRNRAAKSNAVNVSVAEKYCVATIPAGSLAIVTGYFEEPDWERVESGFYKTYIIFDAIPYWIYEDDLDMIEEG